MKHLCIYKTVYKNNVDYIFFSIFPVFERKCYLVLRIFMRKQVSFSFVTLILKNICKSIIYKIPY